MTKQWVKSVMSWVASHRKTAIIILVFALALVAAFIIIGHNPDTTDSEVSDNASSEASDNSSENGEVAKVESIYGGSGLYSYGITAVLKPGGLALPDRVYLVELYKGGERRGAAIVSWSQPDLAVKETKKVEFPITKQEYDAYYRKDIGQIFQLHIHPNPISLPSVGGISHRISISRGDLSSRISGEVYNDSEWTIGRVRIKITILSKTGADTRYWYIPVSPEIIPPDGSGTFDRAQCLPPKCYVGIHSLEWEWIPP